MKRTLMMTAAMIFTGQMAFAAIDPQALADSYVADGYTYVEVKQGPTQTKIEAVKGTSVVEAVYDNDTGEIISQETQTADAEEQARTGVEVRTTDGDFEDHGDENDDPQAGDEDDDHDEGDDDGDHDDGDEGDHDDGDDGDGGDDDGDHGGGEGGDGDGDHGGGSGGNDSSGGDCE
jgi:uncharacterized membrane protein YgcG